MSVNKHEMPNISSSKQTLRYKIHQLSVKCQVFTEMLNTKAGKKLFTVSRKHSTFASSVKGSNSSYLFMQLYRHCERSGEMCCSHDANKEIICKMSIEKKKYFDS